MPAYLVTLGEVPGLTLIGGDNTVIVFASDADDAKAMAKISASGDANNAWNNATVTEIAAEADLEDFRLRILIPDATTPIDVTVTGGTSATVDTIATAIVTQLNNDSQIANAAYVAGTNTLTVAGAADSLGDKTLVVEFLPPLTKSVVKDASIPIPGFVGTITDQGSAGSALTVVLVDAANPAIYASVKS